MQITEDIAIALWHRAKASEIGIAITVNQEAKIIISNFLYAARAKTKDLSLHEVIMLMPGPYPNEIWLARKAVEL